MPDPALARPLALAIAAARVGIGGAALLRTEPALRVAGFGSTDGAGLALARLAGGRDVALGALAFGAYGDDAALRRTAGAAALVDAADAAAMIAALRARDGIDRAALTGALSASAAAIAGAWAASQL